MMDWRLLIIAIILGIILGLFIMMRRESKKAVVNLSEKELREIGLQTVHLVREVYRKRRGQS